MSEPLSVVLLSHLASASAPTGAERSLMLLATALAGRGHAVRIVAPGPSPLDPELRAAGVEVEQIPCRVCWLAYHDPRPAPVALLKWARFAWPDRGSAQLARYLRAVRPDVVHVNCLPHLRGAATAAGLGIPVVWHLREILPPGRRRRWMAAHLERHARRIVAVSEAVGSWVRDEGLADRLEVIRNGVPFPEPGADQATARRELGIPEDGTLIGLFGQLREHKGGIEFIRAARATLERCSEMRFVLAGSGPEHYLSRLRQEIERAGNERIRLLPPQPSVDRLLASADAVCIPSLTPDPLPRSILEAMGAGLPAVASRSGGAPELIADGETGLLVDPGDIEALSEAFVRLENEPELRRGMGRAARVRARESFSLELHVERMERVLSEAAGR